MVKANKTDFSNNFNIFINNPLLIDIIQAPFMTINSEITKKFASQSLEEIKAMVITAKIKAQQGLKEQYTQYESQILNYLNVEIRGEETIDSDQSNYIDEALLHHPHK